MPTVLVIDDDVVMQKVTKRALRDGGYQFIFCHSVEAATAHDLTRADLIIVDQRMPGMSGEEFLLKLRAEGNNLPVIIATGNIDADRIKQVAEGQGNATCVGKPWDKDELAKLVHTALESGIA